MITLRLDVVGRSEFGKDAVESGLISGVACAKGNGESVKIGEWESEGRSGRGGSFYTQASESSWRNSRKPLPVVIRPETLIPRRRDRSQQAREGF